MPKKAAKNEPLRRICSRFPFKSDRRLGEADDRVIWQQAKSDNLIIITKDEDFPLLASCILKRTRNNTHNSRDSAATPVHLEEAWRKAGKRLFFRVLSWISKV